MLIEDEDFDVQRVNNTLAPFKENLIIKKVFADGSSALAELEKNKNAYDVVIMDFQIVGGITGENLIRKIKKADPAIQIIVITKRTVNITDYEFANKLLDAGAMWYCTKYPADIEKFIYQPTDFLLSISNAFEKKILETQKIRSESKLTKSIAEIMSDKVILGASPQIVNLKKQILKAAEQDINVLITGEPGTGKELVANHIHYASRRRSEKFITFNSETVPEELIEMELFGLLKDNSDHSGQKESLFEKANFGTLFLKEISEIPKNTQVKLLRLIETGVSESIKNSENKIDVRFISSTSVDIQEYIRNKKFNEELLYKINPIIITIPPLRERKSDIPLLTDYFLRSFSAEMDVDIPQISEEAMKFLKQYNWPGNVRQLQNVLHRILIVAEEKVSLKEIGNALGLKNKYARFASTNTQIKWDVENVIPWREMERNLKIDYFKFVRNMNKSDSKTAKQLGLAPPNYYRMCKELGIK
jgi:DNA-binding NtrC family response regulator